MFSRIDELFESLIDDEVIEWDEESESYAISENIDAAMMQLDEASVVTFNKKTYPKFGWAVVLAGGPGSGKGYTVKHQIAIDAKIFDVDALKSLYVKTAKTDKPSLIRSRDSKKGKYDFKNPDDVSDLHNTVDQRGYLKKAENAFYADSEAHKESGRIPNVIYDITGSRAEKLKNIGKMLQDMGYKTSLVWVVTNREVAMLRNLSRARTVSQAILHDVHNKIKANVFPFLQSADAKYYDEAWIVFSSTDSLKSLSKEEAKELADNAVVRLEKNGSSFDIPQPLADRIMRVLGADETNPENPEVYKDMEDVKKALEPYATTVTKTGVGFSGKTKTVTTYTDKNKKYDDISFLRDSAVHESAAGSFVNSSYSRIASVYGLMRRSSRRNGQ